MPSTAGANGIDDASNCAVRLRYNITTSDTRACDQAQFTTKAACEEAGGIWSAAFVTASNNDPDIEPGNGQLALPEQDPTVNMGGFLTGNGGTNSLLELAINTNQYGRTFQDRSYVFSLRSRPEGLTSNSKIFNLNVRGKRGNIVQAYPAVEYDFHPTDLQVGANDFVHIQWTGNDNTNNNGNNNGEGTDNTDRHNIVQIKESGLDVPASASEADMFDTVFEWNPEPPNSQFSGTRDKEELTKQFALVKQTGCLTSGQIDGDQQAQNCQKLNAAAATVDMGLLKFKAGTYKYMSSRNNNFSNRAQKAKIEVLQSGTIPPQPPVEVQAVVMEGGSAGMVKVTWQPSGGSPYTSTSGDSWPGMTEQAALASGYMVQMSYDGGDAWWNVEGCENVPPTARECNAEKLMAGTPYQFRVMAGGGAADVTTWSAPSATPDSSTIFTEQTGASRDCQKKKQCEAEGDCLETGTIVAIVFGVIAGIALIGFGIFLLRRRQPPPPPPGGGFKTVPPPQ